MGTPMSWGRGLAAGLVVVVGLGAAAATLQAQTAAAGQAAASQSQTLTFVETQSAEEARKDFEEFMKRFPSSLGRVLVLDPTLMSNQAYMAAYPQLADVDGESSDNVVETYVQVDRDQAARLGVNTTALNSALYNAFGQRSVATIYNDRNQYSVIMEWAPRFQPSPVVLADL